MKRLAYALLPLGAILLLAGCPAGGNQPATDVPTGQPAEAGADPVPPPPPPPPPPPSPAPKADGGAPDLGTAEQAKPADPTSGPSSASTTAQRPTVPPSTPTASQPTRPTKPAGRSSIRLSAGVALPQSLPTGTAMSFSVDYEFTQGQPDPSTPYVWVIEPAKGEPVRVPVRLENKNTLQGFVRKWRPRDGPFQTHIEDGAGNRLSASGALQ